MANLEVLKQLDDTLTVSCRTTDDLEYCKTIFTKDFSFKILNFNIRSLQKNFDEFIVALERISITFDVILLTECHLGSCPLIRNLPSYNAYCSSTVNNKAGGVVAYIHEDWRATARDPKLTDADSILLKFPNSKYILGIYRSPAFRDIHKFLNSIETCISNLPSPKQDLIILGDLNINILDVTSQCNDYLCLMARLGLQSLINTPTRVNTCLDHIFTCTRSKAVGVVCNSGITDHSIVMAGIRGRPFRRPLPQSKTIIDYAKVRSKLECVDWREVLNCTNVSECADKLTGIFMDVIKNNTTTIKISRRKKILKGWITPGLIKCMRRRDKLHSLTSKIPNDIEIQTVYRNYRNVLANLLRKLKTQYHAQQLVEKRNDPKELWKTIQNICEINKKENKPCELLNISDTPAKSLDKCNEYFANIGQDLATSILDRLGESLVNITKSVKITSSSPSSFFFSPTDIKEVTEIISKLKTGSAGGLDGIKTKLIKELCPFIAAPLVHIINLSMSSGEFPEAWKTAAVVPIHKNGSKMTPSNFRPISLLPVFSKILEKVINIRLQTFLEKYNLLSDFQFGFRTGKSTEDAVSLLVNEVVSSLDKGHSCIGIFLDLAKAFDTVPSGILLRKLESIGIRGIPLSWFKSYLSHRRQCVVLSGHISGIKSVNFGVPQGSVLGPTLFSIFLNDITDLLPNNESIRVVCYADDTAIIFSGLNWQCVFEKAQRRLQSIVAWLDNNLLTLNIDKTKYLCFYKTTKSSPKMRHNLQIHRCGLLDNGDCSCNCIERVDHIKYLGITLDERLTFKAHVSLVSTRTRKLIHIMKLLRDAADITILKLVYTSLCESILNYCIGVWGGATKTCLISVEKAQRSVLKVMLHKSILYPTNLLYQEAKVLTIRQLYVQKAVLTYHKVFKKTSSKHCLSPPHRRLKVPVPKLNTTFARRFSHFSYPYIYQRLLPICDISSCTSGLAKNKLKKWLLSQDYNETETILKKIV